MKKLVIKNLASVQKLEYNIYRTTAIISSLYGAILMMEHLDLKQKVRKISLDDDVKKSLKAFELPDKNDKNYIYEIGYIGLFANFEIFMADFLKELFLKFPKSYPKDLKLDFEELSMLTSVKRIKEFMIDKAAINKSYDLKVWIDFLRDNYKIKIFLADKDKNIFLLLNEFRNSLLHSGGKINSKFKKFLKDNHTYIKNPKLNIKFTNDNKLMFNWLLEELKKLLGNLKKF